VEERIDSLFQVHILNERGKGQAVAIANAFTRLLDEISTMSEPGREWSIVKTKLEEAAFFAKKAMANDPRNQEVQ
jgi:hypothetical protein